MSKIPSPHFQMESWAIDFWISSVVIFGIIYIWPIYQSLDKRIWFTILFFRPKESCTLRNIFFCQTMTYFVPIGVIKDRITKMYPKYLNGKLWPYHLSCFINSFLYDPANKAWLFEKFIFELEAFYSFKITCILVRQVISLKKNGGVSAKFIV